VRAEKEAELAAAAPAPPVCEFAYAFSVASRFAFARAMGPICRLLLTLQYCGPQTSSTPTPSTEVHLITGLASEVYTGHISQRHGTNGPTSHKRQCSSTSDRPAGSAIWRRRWDRTSADTLPRRQTAEMLASFPQRRGTCTIPPLTGSGRVRD